MSAEPSLAIQYAVETALINADVAAGRVYLRVPARTPLPYVEFGQDHVIGAHDEGGDMFEADIEVTAYAATMDDLKAVVGDIFTALFRPIPTEGFNVFEFRYDGTYYRPALDNTSSTGTAEEGTISFSYMLERKPTI